MDVAQIAGQLVSALGNNQDLVAQLMAHPYSTTAKVAGTDEQISKSDMSQILTQVAALAGKQELSSQETASAASALLDQSDNSVHALASMLFGGAAPTSGATTDAAPDAAAPNASKPANTPSYADILAKSAAGAVSSRVFASLLTSALSLNQRK